jgi:c-di-AMP phosphodiesterase-like protein
MESDINNIINMLQKENQALKKIIKEKGINNETLESLLLVLEIQRERINCLEEGI